MIDPEFKVVERDYRRLQKAIRGALYPPGIEFYEQVGNRLKNMFLMGFRRSQAPDGSAWAPLKYREGKPLILTGRLRNSISHRARPGQTEVGTNVAYAKAMQYGLDQIDVPEHTRVINSVYGRRLSKPVKARVRAHKRNANVPARPFLGIETPQKRMILQVYKRYLTRQTGQEPT